jgi:hypothetical protein
VVPLQDALPWGGGSGHGVHEEPQVAFSLFETQFTVFLPQSWYPSTHAMSQAPPVQTALACCTPVPGAGQVAQLAPHWLAVSGTHVPPHSMFPSEQAQSRPHSSGVPRHVAVAPTAVGQALQVSPQWAGDELLTHCPLHRWYPVLQVIAHSVPLQVDWPWGSVGQAAQEAPQADGLLFATQVLPHRW